MDFVTQDIAAYLPLNRSDNMLEINHHYGTDDRMLIIFLSLIAGSILYLKESCRSVLISLLRLLVSFVLSLIILPPFFGMLLVFAVYRQFIVIFQKIKLGSKYGGILLGPDAIWAIEDSHSKSIINVLMVVKSDESGEEFYERVEKQIHKVFFETCSHSNKVLATYEKCSGYFILKKDDVNLRDCVKPLKVVGRGDALKKEELLDLVSEASNLCLPKNHSAFWEVYIGTQRVFWNTNDDTCFPIVFRVHHALGDGASLLKVLVNTLVNQEPTVTEERYTATGKIQLLTTIARNLLILLQAPFAILVQSVVRKPDDTSLHGPLLKGDKIAVLASEKQRSCIATIKKTKRNIPGVTFSDVIFAAVSNSFQEYFIKKLETVPKSLTSVIPAFPQYGKPQQRDNVAIGTRGFQNSFSVALLDLPIAKKSTIVSSFNSIDAIKSVNLQTSALAGAIDYQVNYWILSVVSKYLPEALLRPIIESSQATLVISNLPGPKYLSIFEVYPLEDIAFWIPHRGNTGLGVSILSYDGRLQIGLNVDKALIPEKEDAQSIVDGILNEIGKMGDEINSFI